MKRPGLHLLDTSGAADGDAPLYDVATDEWVPGTVVQSIVAGTNTTVDSTDPANPVIAATAGGGGTVYDRRWIVGTSETTIDEHNDGSLDSNWVRVDSAGSSARIVWTEDANSDVLSVKVEGGDAANELHALMFPLTSAGGSIATGDAFITAFKLGSLAGGNYVFGGLLVADGTTYGAGNQVVCTSHFGGSSRAHFLRAATNYNTFTTLDSTGDVVNLGILYYIRLVYLGSNSWRRDLSFDGVTWIKGTAGSKTITATHVGYLASSFGGGSTVDGSVSYEFLRRVSGIT